MDLREIGATLPPGFKFCPSDEELICHYLYNKIANEEGLVLNFSLVEIDLHTCEPWQLPEMAKLNSSEWYFFSFRDRKYTTGFRANRATTSGYWKATGKDRTVLDPQTRNVIGMRKTLVFYKNRAPNGIKTDWIMHEFRLENPHIPLKEDWVLCRVFYKNKGENNNNCTNKLSSQNKCEAIVTSSNVSQSPLYMNQHSLNCDIRYHNSPHQIIQNSNTIIHHHHLFDLLVKDHHEMTRLSECSQEDDDQYRLLFDIDFEESYVQDERIIHSSLEDMRFDEENSAIFI